MNNEYEKTLRQGMIYQAAAIWNLSTDKILASIQQLNKVLSQPCAEKVERSYRILEDILVGLKTSEDYPEKEDPVFFKNSIEELEDVFKHLLEAYMVERSQSLSSDSIDHLNRRFYDDIARRRKLPPGKYVIQAYPPITFLVRLLRNCEKHEPIAPVDHITGRRAFGNVYTLCSTLILAVYAYMEILQTWVQTETTHLVHGGKV